MDRLEELKQLLDLIADEVNVKKIGLLKAVDDKGNDYDVVYIRENREFKTEKVNEYWT